MNDKEHLDEVIRIRIDAPAVDFHAAREAAERISRERLKDPFLLAWYDGVAGKGHPDVHECTGRPGWQAYAESRGGRLTVDVNGGTYVLIFMEASP